MHYTKDARVAYNRLVAHNRWLRETIAACRERAARVAAKWDKKRNPSER
jgi:hypothetical protein